MITVSSTNSGNVFLLPSEWKKVLEAMDLALEKTQELIENTESDVEQDELTDKFEDIERIAWQIKEQTKVK